MSFCFSFQEFCQNYIRIIVAQNSGNLLICGTNAFKPMCRDYGVKPDGFFLNSENSGQAICPYSPAHNSTHIYVGKFSNNIQFPFVLLCLIITAKHRVFFLDGSLYTGTVADFSGTDPIIYREPLQTEQFDSSVLNGMYLIFNYFSEYY